MEESQAGRARRDLELTDKQRMALELRRSGLSYDAIARQVGYADQSGAYRAVKLALKKTLREPADGVRKLELDRLDAMLASLWARVANGDTRAAETALRVMERRARLLGLDAPTRVDQAGDVRVRVEYAELIDHSAPAAESLQPEAP